MSDIYRMRPWKAVTRKAVWKVQTAGPIPQHICTVDLAIDGQEIIARLISAAREYEIAARDISENAEANYGAPDYVTPQSYTISVAHMNALRAAIAKSKGEQ